MNTSKVLLAVLGGVAAGALIGVLMAPDKGSSTRKKYMNKGKNYIGDLKDKFEDLYEDANKKYENVVSKYDNAIADTKEFVSKEAK